MPLRFGQKVQAVPRQADLNHLNVVAGILLDAAGRVLITERVDDGPFHGLWEFPGGKIRESELSRAALARELTEEIGVELVSSEYFLDLIHDYPDRRVAIEFHLVSEWRNEPVGLEGQALRWVRKEKLEAAQLLPADLPVIEALKAL